MKGEVAAQKSSSSNHGDGCIRRVCQSQETGASKKHEDNDHEPQGFQNRRNRIPVARCCRNAEEFLHATEITDCPHLPFIKTEEESIAATDNSDDQFAFRWKLQWNRRQPAWTFR